MDTEQVVSQYNLWIDSDSANTGTSGGKIKLNLPPNLIHSEPNEFLRLKLLNFNMPNVIYKVNPSNDTCMLSVNSGAAFNAVTMENSNYATYHDLADAFGAALVTTLNANAGGGWTLNTGSTLPAAAAFPSSTSNRKMRIQVDKAGHGLTAGQVILQARDLESRVDPPRENASDSYELLGAKRVLAVTLPSTTQSFIVTVNTNDIVVESYYPMTLYTGQGQLYLICSNARSNTSTFHYNHKGTTTQSLELLPSGIVGTMSIQDQAIFYSNPNGDSAFSCDLPDTALTEINLEIRNHHGLFLSEFTLDDDQFDLGSLSYSMCLRIERIRFTTPNTQALLRGMKDLLRDEKERHRQVAQYDIKQPITYS